MWAISTSKYQGSKILCSGFHETQKFLREEGREREEGGERRKEDTIKNCKGNSVRRF